MKKFIVMGSVLILALNIGRRLFVNGAKEERPAAAGGGPAIRPCQYLVDQHRMETSAEYAQRILADAGKMTDELKKIGVADPVDFAWPDGKSTAIAKNILLQLGYRYFFLQQPGVNRPDPSAKTWDIYRVYPGNSAQSMLAAIKDARR